MKYLATCFVLAIAIQLVFAGVDPKLKKKAEAQRCLQKELPVARNCFNDEEPNKSCILDFVTGLKKCLGGKASRVDIRKYAGKHENSTYTIVDGSDSGFSENRVEDDLSNFPDSLKPEKNIEELPCVKIMIIFGYKQFAIVIHFQDNCDDEK